MTARPPVRVIASLALAALAAIGASLASQSATSASARDREPNVIVIMTDDQTLRSMRVLRNTRRLLGEGGVTFDNAFVSWPLCCPSRATYLTGQYAWNHKVAGNLAPAGGYGAFVDRQYDTLPVWLQKRGYYTAHIGKYLNGYGEDAPPDIPPGWSSWQGSVDPSTYCMWGYTLNENGAFRTYGKPRVEDPALYQTVVYREKAIEQIELAARLDKPLYLNLAGMAPHFETCAGRGDDLPPRSEPKYRGAFKDEPLPRDPSFNEADTTDKPPFMQAFYRSLKDDDIAAITRRYRGELEALLSVDDSVATIVRALRRTGQLDNTYIFFTSDNGYFHGEHRIPKTKYWLYDPAARVPLVVRGPGIPPGKVSNALASNVDLPATIADIAGARPGYPLDGRSLLPFARDPGRRTNRPLLFEALQNTVSIADLDTDGPDRTPDIVLPPKPPRGAVTNPQRLAPGYEAIRTERYLYAEYSTGDRELYDLKLDPYELRSQHANPAYAHTMLTLADALAQRRGCAGASCNEDLGPIPGPLGEGEER